MKCDFCKLKSVVNYQKVWDRFSINKNEEYKEDLTFDGGDFAEPVGNDNIHLCRKHEKEWLEGEI